MKTVLAGMAAICALNLGGAAVAQSAVGSYGVKYPVSDFNRSVAYYTKYFPLKKDKVYNDHEISLASTILPDQRPITLYLDDCGNPAGKAKRAKQAAQATDAVHRKLADCTTAFRAGSGWLFIMVADAAKVAAALKADGHEAKPMKLPPKGPGYRLFMTQDPDGNIVEVVEAVNGP